MWSSCAAVNVFSALVEGLGGSAAAIANAQFGLPNRAISSCLVIELQVILNTQTTSYLKRAFSPLHWVFPAVM